MNCNNFTAYEVCTNFRRGLLQRGRRTGIEPLNMVVIHSHHLSDILRCVVVCYIYIIMKALSSFLHRPRVSHGLLADSVDTSLASLL